MDTNLKVLLVEDDPFLSNLLKVRLQKENVDVFLARDGEEALKKIEEDKPSLVLLDLILPKKSGFEILEKISTDPQLKDMPVIILSNLGQTSDIQRGKELGAIEYYVKAKISIDDLVGKVKTFLTKK
ncbi:MAG TPA: response regulator [Candidatus Paceibacterota bacterium]|jgi:DNA-binding response OmpR family regulator|nr:response regulator [Candidatus Paceibacterota bacterium]